MRLTISLLVSASLLLVTQSCFSQFDYEEGYYISNSGEKHTGFIRNEYWINNPNSISYKKSLNSVDQTIELDDLKSFGLKGVLYEKYTVQADLSSNELKDLGLSAAPKYESKSLLLETLIKGELSLYGYTNKGQTYYFYKESSANPIQLIYKLYKVNGSNNLIRKNKQYQQQLVQIMGSAFLANESAAKIEYRTAPLQRLFEKYLTSKQLKTASYSKQTSKVYVGGTARIGVRNAKSEYTPTRVSGSTISTNLESTQQLMFSLDLELFLDGRRKKTAIFFQPTIFKYSSTGLLVFGNSGNMRNLALEYSGLDITFGLKKHFLINNSISLNPKIGYTFFKGNIDFQEGDADRLARSNEGGFYLALELMVQDKWSFQVDYESPRNLFPFDGTLNLKYGYIGVSAGYRFW